MTETREETPLVADECPMLLAWLDYHRATLEIKCSGLSPAQLARRSAPPSTLSLLGLLRHMTDVERHWFQRRLAGAEAPPVYYSEAEPDGDFDLVDEATVDVAAVEETFAAWRSHVARSREIAAELASLDEVRTAGERTFSARWIIIHMIEEYARHNGHADLVRERIDGSTGE